MAVTKDQLMQAAVNEITNYPTIALRYQIGDPLIEQGLASMAAMLADLSNQVEVTAGEPFTKARDVTVRSDAAVKGILPFGTPSIGIIKVTNNALSSIKVLAGRSVQDAAGRYWLVIGGINLMPGEVGFMTAKQVRQRSFTHVVGAYLPFYPVVLAEPEVGYIASVMVAGFELSTDFSNTSDGDRVYNIKSDENSEISLQFGIAGLSGYQPAVGEVISVTIQDTEGEVSLSAGQKYYFEYTGDAAEAMVTMELVEVSQAGANPMDIATMREVCSYPGIYDDSAVFNSNFDFVVRKAVSPVTFLSIWNEAKEEKVRGASLDNINTLFVAARKFGTTKAVLQAQISAVIKRADDSYKIKFVDVIDVVVPMAITVAIPSVYDAAAVMQEVRTLLLDEYGPNSAWAKRGEAQILEKDIYALLERVVALSARRGNLVIDSIGDDSEVLPEHYRYITTESLTINAVEAG
ncbi:hypothetical protein AB4P95_29950 (plasmid) [Pseudomonas sp. A1437]|uniref:hypothetical protein n=1 Tax=Pseudomonas sp. A1437 TaxID=3235107 RepID=UPI003782EE04